MKDKKNNKKGFRVLVVLLILIIVCLIGYICYDTFTAKNDLKTTNEENSEVVKDEEAKDSENDKEDPIKLIAIDSKEVVAAKKSFDKIIISSDELYDSNGYNIEKISDYDLIATAFENSIRYGNKNFGIDKYIAYCVSEKSQLKSAFPISELNQYISAFLEKKITADTIKGLKKESSYTLAQYEVDNMGIILEGDKIRLVGPCDGTFLGSSYNKTKIISAEKNSKYLYIYEKTAFGILPKREYSEDEIFSNNLKPNYYKDREGKELVKTGLKDWNVFNTYKYTFKISNDHYYFQKFELTDK